MTQRRASRWCRRIGSSSRERRARSERGKERRVRPCAAGSPPLLGAYLGAEQRVDALYDRRGGREEIRGHGGRHLILRGELLHVVGVFLERLLRPLVVLGLGPAGDAAV